MLYGCTNLKELNLLSFDTTNVFDMSYMFYECENLINLDVSGFNNKKVKNIEGIFYNCNKLKDSNLSFYVKNFDKYIDIFNSPCKI